RCHAMPRYGATRRDRRRGDSDNGIDQVSCGVTVRQARWIEIGPPIDADLPGRGLQPEERKWRALGHRFSCSRLSGSQAVMRSAATSTSSNSEFFDVRLMLSLVARSVPLFYFTLLDRVQRQLHRERDQLRSMRSETARGHARAQLDLCLDVCEE